MSKLYVEDIHKDDLIVEYELHQYYDKLVAECCDQIRNVHKHLRKEETIFRVPYVISEDERYDFTACITHIIKSLRNGGFYVRYLKPNQIYISWFNKAKEKRKLDIFKTLYVEDMLTQKTLNTKKNKKAIEYA